MRQTQTNDIDYVLIGFYHGKRIGSDFVPKHHNKHHAHPHCAPRRPKMPPPIFWERPYFPAWDPNVHYANYHSQDDNYFDEYYNHRVAHNDCCRYDSDGNISVNKAKLMSPSPASPSNYSAYCANRFYTKPPPIHHQCYSCERSSSSIAAQNPSKFNKVHRTLSLSCLAFCFWL